MFFPLFGFLRSLQLRFRVIDLKLIGFGFIVYVKLALSVWEVKLLKNNIVNILGHMIENILKMVGRNFTIMIERNISMNIYCINWFLN